MLLFFLIPASLMFASEDNPTKDELLRTVKHIQALAKQQQADLDAAHEHETALQTDLDSVKNDLGNAQSQLVDTQVQINKLAQHDSNETAAKKHILHKYHILKGIAMAIAAACAVFLVMRLTSFIPMAIMPYKIYLYAGAGVAAAAAVAIWL